MTEQRRTKRRYDQQIVLYVDGRVTTSGSLEYQGRS